MKHGLRLTKKQKIFLADKGLNPQNWLRVKDTPEKLEVVHRASGNIRIFRKGA